MSLHVRADHRFKPPLEKVVQAGITDLFRKAGVHVGSTSQYRASHIEEGVPDLLCHALLIQAFFWFEVKSYETVWKDPEGRSIRYTPYDRSTWWPKPLSPKQLEFQARARCCNVRHAFGGMPQAEQVLVELGLGYRTPNGLFCYGRPR